MSADAQSGDMDSPWKEALERYFEAFMEFFFPEAYAGIDWTRGYEFLDKELQQVVRDAESGRRHVDKLAKVWRNDGEEAWVLAHVEVQSNPERGFPKRMYQYNYRLFDRYDRPVASFAVLADGRAGWRPTRYGYEFWGCKVGLEFPVVKLLDYESRWLELEQSANPFAVLVRGHLKARETRRNPEERLKWKWTLVRELYERGYAKEDILNLFRFLDWLMALPDELERRFDELLAEYEEEKKMPYVTSIERLGIQRGIQQGMVRDAQESVVDILEARFQRVPRAMVRMIRGIEDAPALKALRRRAAVVGSPKELEGDLSEYASG